jgi:hypothetical protein
MLPAMKRLAVGLAALAMVTACSGSSAAPAPTLHLDRGGVGFSTAAASYDQVTGSLLRFSLSRPTPILVLWNVTGYADPSGETGGVDLFVDGASQSNSWPGVLFTNSGIEQTGSAYWSGTLAAGAHALDLRAAVGEGGSLHVDALDIAVLPSH